jgi:hypothetical protein
MRLRFQAKENITVSRDLLSALREAGSFDVGEGSTWSKTMTGNQSAWLHNLSKLLGFNLKNLGQGSSRTVYALSEDLVLKVARNKAGIAQNEAEYRAYEKLPDCSIIARIFYYQKDFQWLVVERILRRTDDSDFQMYGINTDQMSLRQMLDLVVDGTPAAKLKFLNPAFNRDFRALRYIVKRTNGMMGEIAHHKQWGIVERKGQEYPVLVDYGLTSKVYDRYYR